MPVTIDPSGRRSVSVQVQVPGSQQDVWTAIATGPGVSAWFVPTEFHNGPDGTPQDLVCDFGGGMVSRAEVTAWEPPHHFTAESSDFAPGGPPVATEWTVEPLEDDVCLVTVEHSLLADTDEWDPNLEGTESGWPAFFNVLRIRMAHFPDEPFAIVDLMGKAAAPDSAWADLAAALGLTNAAPGEHCSSAPDAPTLAGIVESVPDDSEVLLRLEQPTPGVAHLFALNMGDDTYLSVRLYLYSEEAAATAQREQPVWETWMKDRLTV